ncbi:MAG: T9SS type A sorting domain-containing protein, partial [Bacteroidota bacterium]
PVGATGDPSDNVWAYNTGCPGTFTWNVFRAGTWPMVPWYYRDPTTCAASCYYDIFPFIGFINQIVDCNTSSCNPPYLIANVGHDEREYFFGNAVKVLVDSTNISSGYFEQVYDAYIFLKQNKEWLSIGTDDQDYIDFVDAMDATVLGKFYFANHFSHIPDSLSYAQDALDNISPAHDWEQIWKDVMQVYLDTWAVGTLDFNSHNQSILDDAASHDLNLYGPGVLMAHVMLGSEAELDTVPNPYRMELQGGDNDIIYPNPNDGNFLVDANGAFTFELFDLTGKLLYEKKFDQSSMHVFLPEHLTNGCYLYRVTQENGYSKSGLLNLLK